MSCPRYTKTLPQPPEVERQLARRTNQAMVSKIDEICDNQVDTAVRSLPLEMRGFTFHKTRLMLSRLGVSHTGWRGGIAV